MMKFLSSSRNRRDNSPLYSNSKSSSLPPIDQYVPTKTSLAGLGYNNTAYNKSHEVEDYQDTETRTNTLRNSVGYNKPILKKKSSMNSINNYSSANQSANAAAAAALSRSNSMKMNKAPIKKTPLNHNNNLRTYSLSRIDESPLSRSNSHRHKVTPKNGLTQLSSFQNRVPTRTNSLMSNSSNINGRTSSFSSLPPNSRRTSMTSIGRKQSMTSLLGTNSLNLDDMTIQSTVTKKGNMIVKQTKLIDSDGVTKRIITKTIKKVGNYEIVKSNVINLSDDPHNSILNDANIDDLGELEELNDDDFEDLMIPKEIDHFEGFDESMEDQTIAQNSPVSPQRHHFVKLLSVPPEEIKPSDSNSRSSEGTIVSNHLNSVSTEDREEYYDANSGQNRSVTPPAKLLIPSTPTLPPNSHPYMPPPTSTPSSMPPPSTENRKSILQKSSNEAFDNLSQRSSRSRVSFRGVEIIDKEPVPKKLSEQEMYNAALKVAEAKVLGNNRTSSISSFERNKNGNRSSTFSMRPPNKIPSSPIKTPSPKLLKKVSVSDSLRSFGSFNKPKEENGFKSLRNNDEKITKKKKKYLKEEQKLNEMDFNKELEKAKLKYNKKFNIKEEKVNEPVEVEEPIAVNNSIEVNDSVISDLEKPKAEKKKKFKLFKFKW